MKRVVLFGSAVAAIALTGCSPSPKELVAKNSSTISKYCLDCHNNIEQVAGLSLERLDLAHVGADAATWEKVVKMLRSGQMPPSDGRRPDGETRSELVSYLVDRLDANYKPILPPPGVHRLNRTEYQNVVRDLLGIELDASKFLPADDTSRGFDNQAGTLTLSTALLEAYVSAAGRISREALGDVTQPTQTTFRVPADTTQNYHVEGLPFGTRGGILINHYFPVDGRYTIKVYSVNLGNMGNFRPFGEVKGEQLEILVDGKRVHVFDWDKEFGLNRGAFGGFGGQNGHLKTLDLELPITAGQHKIGVTFLASNYAPLLDLDHEFERSTIETGGLPGMTFYPHVGSVRIDGPFDAKGAEDSPAKARLYVCNPKSADTPADERACAEQIVAKLAHRAYRGFDSEQDVSTLMDFYENARKAGGDFDAGIQAALQRVLADPRFIYRIEKEPENVAPGDLYQVNDLELASRLSFFLWSSMPDDELLSLAEQNKLSDPKVLEKQVRRMIQDPKSFEFTKNFAGQWLDLRSLQGHEPVVADFPDFDDNLRQAFVEEADLFFDSVLREGRSVVDLLDADYTFVNDRLAKHYGIPGVQGSQFRRIKLGDQFDDRRGLLGKGAILTATSQPGRTSPVQRGKWVMAELIGVPPPDPPPNVPALKTQESDAAGNAHTPTMREQMEMHHQNPVCASCHSMMEPFGFVLEAFDAIGKERTTDHGNPIDTKVVMYDGQTVNGAVDLRNWLLKYKQQYLVHFAEKLMTYALGRGIEYYDEPVVRKVVRESAKDDYSLESMIMAVVDSQPFRENMKLGDKSLKELTQQNPKAEKETVASTDVAAKASLTD
ncbi:MAG TPA: DUF1592 domain-containing protein [Gammaproteobacteria bacterium]|nr:DUF1592 domain-containing protein [Gammaproteobacteria bacterium]